MKVSDLLRSKGDKVVTVKSDDSVKALVDLLAEHKIGALVVSDDGTKVDGIVSERDIVRQLQTTGTQVLDQQVSTIMTSEVVTCAPGDSVEVLATSMTEHRIRHMPVVVDGNLKAIVSIGDVVKQRIAQLTDERDQLVGYLHQ